MQLQLGMENNKTKQGARAYCKFSVKSKKLKNSAKHFDLSHKTERKVKIIQKEFKVFVKKCHKRQNFRNIQIFVMK